MQLRRMQQRKWWHHIGDYIDGGRLQGCKILVRVMVNQDYEHNMWKTFRLKERNSMSTGTSKTLYIIFDIFLFLNIYIFVNTWIFSVFPSFIQFSKSSNAFNWFRMNNEKTLLATSQFALIENNSNHITSLKMLKCFIYRNVRL